MIACIMSKPVFLRRIRTAEFIKTLRILEGYQHMTFTRKADEALPVDEPTATRLCDFDFLGKPYREPGYNGLLRKPEYERVNELPLTPSSPATAID